jgi:DNA-binding NarL/FixJ family response regulator
LSIRPTAEADAPHNELPVAELAIARLAALGLSDREIGSRLQLL